MTKIETLRNYAEEQAAPQLQVVQAIRDLQQLTEQLPQAVATEVHQALQPLASLSSLDDLLEQQRRSLEILSQEMIETTETATAPITATTQQISQAANEQRKAADRQAKQIASLAQQFRLAAGAATKATNRLDLIVDGARKREWIKLIAVALIGGLISGGVMLAGMHVFGGPAQPDVASVQQIAPAPPAASRQPAR